MDSTERFKQYFQQLPDCYRPDAVGIKDLEQVLRDRIERYLNTEIYIGASKPMKGTYSLLSQGSGVSRSYIWKFFNGKSICLTNMNRLADYFGVTYVVSNFPVE
ncbi:hypothetical protein CHH28_08940 [Bacterioplanes sanyensis]|uniref:HTH cro/C1-type domain-containing protein n=1 Tax=Bacterioplanes sanyensis TaxID=1249553 RepID=A0A222FII2_9GAMM|nr:helix-turn-helix transcriptional regulator [Bacterioplanes sanyensis]ASP38798.1 hypothetical protein CHH28_08940 [Bacterioplanes sanyensis]